MTTFQIRDLARVVWLNPQTLWRTIIDMEENLTPTRSYRLAVIMERVAISSRWASEQWSAIGVVRDTAGGDARVIVEHDRRTQMLFPGHCLTLLRDEAEGYYLNLTSPEPKVFVLWRPLDGIARPERMTVSYGEGTRWADSGEQVDGVPIPPDLLAWMAAFVELNYRPEPPKKKRYASNKDRGRMGHFE